MTTATAAKPPKTKPSIDVAAIARRESELAEAAEMLLWEVADGKSLSADEHAVLQAAFPNPGKSFKDFMHSEVNRIRRIKDAQAKSGTPSERAALLEQVIEANKRFVERSEQIDTEIQKLQTERRELEKTVRDLDLQLIAKDKAAEALKDETLLPIHVQRQLRHERQLFRDKWREHVKHQRELTEIEKNLERSDSELAGNRICQDLALADTLNDGLRVPRERHIAAFREQLAERRDELQARVSEHEAEYLADCEAIAALVEFYAVKD